MIESNLPETINFLTSMKSFLLGALSSLPAWLVYLKK
jgi:hypothetical protein